MQTRDRSKDKTKTERQCSYKVRPINDHPGKMCSCEKMCKSNRGQRSENKLVAPPQNVILSSCLTFDDSIYYRTSDNNFIPISNSEKSVAGNKCNALAKDIIMHPLTEYLCKGIIQCGATSCHTCNIFNNEQSFKSNLTGKEYKTISYDRLSCGSTHLSIEYIMCSLWSCLCR